MPLLKGLPDTANDVEATTVSSVTAAVKAIRRGEACTATGRSGAIVVWRDDAGRWRCEFCVRRKVVGYGNFGFKALVHDWLKLYWPKLSAAS